jgi:hypothetical protein
MNRGSRDKWVLFSLRWKSSIYESIVRCCGAALNPEGGLCVLQLTIGKFAAAQRIGKNPECGNGKIREKKNAIRATFMER